MYDYGEACPISKATSILGERWTIQILREMMLGAARFSEFQRLMPRISPTILNTRLKSLEESGIVLRKRMPEQRGFAYYLTPAGKALRPMMAELGKWGMRWAFEGLVDEELNAVAILRDIAVKMKLDELPAGDLTIEFHLTDLPDKKVRYILVRDGAARMCDENPGYEVDLYVRSNLRTLTELWYGFTDLAAARTSGAFEVVGPTVYTRSLARWFPTSDFAADNPHRSVPAAAPATPARRSRKTP